jgi:hypothetical protein
VEHAMAAACRKIATLCWNRAPAADESFNDTFV